MHYTMTDERVDWVEASRKRIILSIYLDFIIFNVIWAFVRLWLLDLFPAVESFERPMRFLLFTFIELILHKAITWSPGNYMLTMKYMDMRDYLQTQEIMPGKKVAVVNATIKRKESWLTILVGVILINEGLKSVVRWTMWTPPIPFFGIQTSAAVSAGLLVLMGIIECYIGLCIFKLKRIAIPAGIIYFSGMLISVVLSWRLWDPWMKAMVFNRRAYQGLEVRPGEVEFMQKIFPEGMIIGVVIYLILVIISSRHIVKANM